MEITGVTLQRLPMELGTVQSGKDGFLKIQSV